MYSVRRRLIGLKKKIYSLALPSAIEFKWQYLSSIANCYLAYVDIAFILVRCDVYRMIFSMLERSQCQIHILFKIVS